MLRVGVAGLGTASALSLPALARHPGVQLAAAADPRADALASFRAEHGGATFESVEAMCASDLVDAVYICTPNAMHAAHAVMAAEHGKHILVEKPIALTLEEADLMIIAAERAGVQLVCGHTQAFEPVIRRMRALVHGGELGRLLMINSWSFTDLLYRPRADWELDTRRGGGAVFIQASHQADVARLLGGGVVRSVRAMTGVGDASRPTEGHYAAYLELADGVPATLVYSGYAHFDTAELYGWVDGQGFPRDPRTHARTRAAARDRTDEAAARETKRYGPASALGGRLAVAPGHPFFGLTVVSLERGDLRQTADGIRIDGDLGPRELPVSGGVSGRDAMLDELCAAVRGDRPPLHDGRWAKATLEVCLAILASAKSREEVVLRHQVPVRDELLVGGA